MHSDAPPAPAARGRVHSNGGRRLQCQESNCNRIALNNVRSFHAIHSDNASLRRFPPPPANQPTRLESSGQEQRRAPEAILRRPERIPRALGSSHTAERGRRRAAVIVGGGGLLRHSGTQDVQQHGGVLAAVEAECHLLRAAVYSAPTTASHAEYEGR